MDMDPFQQEYRETIEADAVCNQCGTVNPEGTLICKKCGNNLRDQRQMRLAADQAMAGGEPVPAEKRSHLRHALTVLGLLVIVWLALNMGRIGGMWTAVPDENAGGVRAHPYIFWQGPDVAAYEALEARLDAAFPTESAAENARLNPSGVPRLDGTFALYERLGTGVRFAGGAVVQVAGDKHLFAARLLNGTTIRGEARNGAPGAAAGKAPDAASGETAQAESQPAPPGGMPLSADWTQVGIKHNDQYYAGTGFVVPAEDGGLTIVAAADFIERNFQALAYPMTGY